MAISFNQWQSVPDRRSTSTRLSVSRQSVAINQWRSVPDCSSAFSRLSVSRQSVPISGNQWQTVAISGNHFPPGERVGQRGHVARAHSVSISFNRRQSVLCRGNRRQAVLCRGNRCQSVAISGNHFPHWKRRGILQGCRCVGSYSRRGIRRGVRRCIAVGRVLGGVLPSVAIGGNHFPPEKRVGQRGRVRRAHSVLT